MPVASSFWVSIDVRLIGPISLSLEIYSYGGGDLKTIHAPLEDLKTQHSHSVPSTTLTYFFVCTDSPHQRAVHRVTAKLRDGSLPGIYTSPQWYSTNGEMYSNTGYFSMWSMGVLTRKRNTLCACVKIRDRKKKKKKLAIFGSSMTLWQKFLW